MWYEIHASLTRTTSGASRSSTRPIVNWVVRMKFPPRIVNDLFRIKIAYLRIGGEHLWHDVRYRCPLMARFKLWRAYTLRDLYVP